MNKRKQVVIVGIDPQVMGDKEICNIIKVTDIVFKKALELMKASGDERMGGYATIIREDLWPLAVRIPLGIIPPEKATKWSELSTEKCLRLMKNEDHFTSYESRDPDAEITTLQGETEKWGKWGGAVRVLRHLLGFSGFAELWDEAVELVVGIKTGLLDMAETFVKISPERNPHLRPLLAAAYCQSLF